MATAAARPTVLTREERANQRNAVLAGFLGWTLDAFDFFVLTFVVQDVATAFGKTRPDILLTVSLALVSEERVGPYAQARFVVHSCSRSDLRSDESYA